MTTTTMTMNDSVSPMYQSVYGDAEMSLMSTH
jgi:hypothetical protein